MRGVRKAEEAAESVRLVADVVAQQSATLE
jgi:hypothetical protein